MLLERAYSWRLTPKVLLPGVLQLERFIAELSSHVQERLWLNLGRSVNESQRQQLHGLLLVGKGSRSSKLDQLRSGPVTVIRPALIRVLRRLDDVLNIGISLPAAVHISASRIAALARLACEGHCDNPTTDNDANGNAGCLCAQKPPRKTIPWRSWKRCRPNF